MFLNIIYLVLVWVEKTSTRTSIRILRTNNGLQHFKPQSNDKAETGVGAQRKLTSLRTP